MVWSRPWEKCAIPLTSHANTKSIKNIAEKLETKKAHDIKPKNCAHMKCSKILVVCLKDLVKS